MAISLMRLLRRFTPRNDGGAGIDRGCPCFFNLCFVLNLENMVIKNKKAFFDYEVLEKVEAGIELLGCEVKSLRQGKASLAGAYVSVRNGEAFLRNSTISPYQPNNIPPDYDKERERKLLLHKKEIAKLAGRAEERGVALIPLKIYDKKGVLKLELGVCKGKKKWDKRETIKRRDAERRIKERE